MPKVGMYPSSAVLHDKIHIFHGERNTKHFVYDPTANSLKTYVIITDRDDADGVQSVVYDNKIMKFSGYANAYKTRTAAMLFCEIDDENETIKWTNKYEWTLPTKNDTCGYILYEHYLVIFGGQATAFEYLDTIYFLDLTKHDEGWKELEHIKCPLPSKYLPVLAPNNHVHLFTETNKWPN